MVLNTKTLRIAFVTVAVALVIAVVGFYAYARYRFRAAIHDIPQKLGVNIQQVANGFKMSKSEGGRMLFSISAASAVQYKGGQHSALNDARIIVYNRGKGTSDPATDIYDQIYGKQFDYDPATGEVVATGEVLIDLQAKGTPPDDPAKTTASPSALHLKTSGLSFNQKTGIAQTKNGVEFTLPQGSGSATGAVYDSKAMSIHLVSNVRLRTMPESRSEKKAGPVTITAKDADFFDMPREAILSGVHLEDEDKSRNISAGRLTVLLRDDNTIEKALATDAVEGSVVDAKSPGGTTKVKSSQAEMYFGAGNNLKSALLTGAVKMDSTGGVKGETHAEAEKALIDFGAKNQVLKVHATQQVKLTSAGSKQDSFVLDADGADFLLRPGGNRLDRAVTSGVARVTLDSKPGDTTGQKTAAHTVATADRFEATFSAVGTGNRIEAVHGIGNTKVVSSSAGNPYRTTTGRELLVKFDAKSGSANSVEQSGDFKYVEAERTASADKATFDMSSDQLTLSGSPAMQDKGQGLALTAKSVKMNRKTGDVAADGEVKATYNQTKGDATGALFQAQSSEPVHATSQRMTASKASGVAHFIGTARLWQGANLVEAPQITFDKEKRNLAAEGTGAAQVQTAFSETDKKGKVTPVSVLSGKLVYSDVERKARFDGGVRMKTADATMVADHADVFLRAKSASASQAKDSSGQIDHIEAQGQIVVEEQNPVRKVTGTRLTYSSDEGKFVMTGEAGKPPSIFDAERGNLTGDSLTFYTHDDRVQVGSGENARVVTKTRIKDERKP